MNNENAPDRFRGALTCVGNGWLKSLLSGALLAAFGSAIPLAAQGISLGLPIDCDLGETCHMQAHFDRDPGPGAVDFECGTLTRDHHRGTDFALNNLASMRSGVDVLAAASGRVVGTRDRWPDISRNDADAPELDGQDCGNGVAIEHGDGWVTQYCHLKLGSIQVREGQEIRRGDPLGEVGLSGLTTFPHLHFSVFRNDDRVDPFAPFATTCGTSEAQLFSPALPTVAAGFMTYGFATRAPGFDEMKDALESAALLSPTDPIVVWVAGFGSRAGDTLDIEIRYPDGVFHSQTVVMERQQEQWQRFSGRRFTTTPWPSGIYEATLIYRRDGEALDTAQFTSIIE